MRQLLFGSKIDSRADDAAASLLKLQKRCLYGVSQPSNLHHTLTPQEPAIHGEGLQNDRKTI
jgi:hypothetical protein